MFQNPILLGVIALGVGLLALLPAFLQWLRGRSTVRTALMRVLAEHQSISRNELIRLIRVHRGYSIHDVDEQLEQLRAEGLLEIDHRKEGERNYTFYRLKNQS